MGAVSYLSNVVSGWHWDDGLAYEQINEETLDDGDYWGIYRAVSVGQTIRKSFTLPNTSLTGAIESVRVYFRVSCQGAGGYYVKPFVYTHSAEYYGSQVVPASDVKTTYSETWSTNPNTGQPWTWAEVNALEPGLEMYSNGTSGSLYAENKNYWLYVVVTYRPPSAPKARLIGLW
jgi:hypothetical protein